MEEEFKFLDTKNAFTKNRLINLLLMGVVMFGYSVYLLSTIWTSRASLSTISGTLENVDTYYFTVTDRHGEKSKKAELIFYLAGIRKKFALAENIGDEYSLREYEQIKNGLRRSDTVTVWIKEDELYYWEPKVYQIASDRKTLLEFETVRLKKRPVALFLFVFGLGCIGFPVYAFYPNLFRKRRN